MRTIIIAAMLLLVGEKAFGQQLLRSYELAAHCKMIDDLSKGYLDGFTDAAELYQLWIISQRTRLPDNKPAFCMGSVSPDKTVRGHVLSCAVGAALIVGGWLLMLPTCALGHLQTVAATLTRLYA